MDEAPKPVAEKEITLRDLVLRIQAAICFLFEKWKWVLLCGVVGLALGISYSLLKAPEYLATISFVTDTDKPEGSNMSAYAGLAAKFGLDLGMGNGGNDLFAGANIFDLMGTRLMLQNTLLTPVEIEGKRDLLINKFIEVDGLKRKWRNKPFHTGLTFALDSSTLTRSQNKVIAEICKLIRKKHLSFPDKGKSSNDLTLMSVNFLSKNEQLSDLFLTNLVNNVARYYVNTTTSRARANLTVLTRQLDSVRAQLYGAMSNVASFQDRNLNLVKEGPRVLQQKSSLRMNVNSAIYQQLVGAVETARMNLQKETPLFEIVDSPVLPLEKKKPILIVCIVVGAFLGGLLCCLALLIGRFYRKLMDTGETTS